MNDKDTAVVPFFVYESACERLMIANKRMWILLLIAIALLFGTNAGWLYYESQWETVETTTTTQTVESDATDGGTATAIFGDSNEVYNGESKDDKDNYND